MPEPINLIDESVPTIPELSVIVPAFNEEEGLEKFFLQLYTTIESCKIDYEIWVVDDGSKDGTWQKIELLCHTYSRLGAIRFTRNFGKEAAILAGLRKATGRAVLVIDSDGQHPPILIQRMLGYWQAGEAEIIAAQKSDRENDTLVSRCTSWLFNRLMYFLTGLNLAEATDYRLLDRKVVDALLSFPEKIRFFRAMTVWTGFRQINLQFAVPSRLAGQSQWGSSHRIRLAITAITAYSAKPLVLVFKLGLFGMLLATILLTQALYSWFTNVAISGWTSLTVVILFFGSANLIAIGVVGSYLAQIFDEIKARPEYLVEKELPP